MIRLPRTTSPPPWRLVHLICAAVLFSSIGATAVFGQSYALRATHAGAGHGPMSGGAFTLQGSAVQPAVHIIGDGAPAYLGAGFRYAFRNVDIALPMELTAFAAERADDAIRLVWQTASETNNAGFELQRSLEGLWETLDVVPGRGTTIDAQTYRFTDDALPFATTEAVYRLRQVDTDGTATLSEEVRIVRGAPTQLVLHGNFPNPFRDQTTLRYELPSATRVQLAVYDLMGRRVAVLVDRRQAAGRAEVSFDAEWLASGTYFARLVADGEVHTRRLLVVR